MSHRRQARRKARRAARDLSAGAGATMAQLDRLMAWGVVGHRVYDRLIDPLLDAQDAGRPRNRITWEEVFPPGSHEEEGSHE